MFNLLKRACTFLMLTDLTLVTFVFEIRRSVARILLPSVQVHNISSILPKIPEDSLIFTQIVLIFFLVLVSCSPGYNTGNTCNAGRLYNGVYHTNIYTSSKNSRMINRIGKNHLLFKNVLILTEFSSIYFWIEEKCFAENFKNVFGKLKILHGTITFYVLWKSFCKHIKRTFNSWSLPEQGSVTIFKIRLLIRVWSSSKSAGGGDRNSSFQFSNTRRQHPGSVTVKSVLIAVLFETKSI